MLLELMLVILMKAKEAAIMRDTDRIDSLLERLAIIWKQNPDLRLGQLVDCGAIGKDVFYVEDDELIEGIEELTKR